MNQSTLDKIKEMNLKGMYDNYVAALRNGQNMGKEGELLLASMVEAEWDRRRNNRISRAIKSARFQYRASIEEITYEEERSLDRKQVEELAECQFVERGENLLITGATGVGKSYLATAIGYQACMEGKKVKYTTASKFFASMKIAKLENIYLKELEKLKRPDLIILDDFGINALDKQDRMTLLEVLEDRQPGGSLTVTSQLPVGKWFDIIGEKTIADAIMDRLVHPSHRIELKGDSMRKKVRKTKSMAGKL